MKAVIIGCNGYIGKHLTGLLLDHGFFIFGYDVQMSTFDERISYIPFNLTDKNDMTLIEMEVDFIFFLSGKTGTLNAYDDFEQYIDINEVGLLHVLDRMRYSKTLARIIFPSTRLIYKGVNNEILNEDSEKEFKTIYSLNKWFGEKVIDQYSKYFNVRYNIFRICLPYGNLYNTEYSYGTVGFFLSKAKSKQNLVLFGEGSQKRTFTHVEDICLQILQTVLNKESVNSTFNIEGETYSLKDIAMLISDKFSVNIEQRDWPLIDRMLETGDTIFDSQKIKKYSPKPLKHSMLTWLSNIK